MKRSASIAMSNLMVAGIQPFAPLEITILARSESFWSERKTNGALHECLVRECTAAAIASVLLSARDRITRLGKPERFSGSNSTTLEKPMTGNSKTNWMLRRKLPQERSVFNDCDETPKRGFL
jgi:hypothetical protein